MHKEPISIWKPFYNFKLWLENIHISLQLAAGPMHQNKLFDTFPIEVALNPGFRVLRMLDYYTGRYVKARVYVGIRLDTLQLPTLFQSASTILLMLVWMCLL